MIELSRPHAWWPAVSQPFHYIVLSYGSKLCVRTIWVNMTPQRPTLIDIDQITNAWSTWADTRLNPAEEVFQYDLAGNRTYVFNDANGIAQTYAHVPATNRLTRFIQSEAGNPLYRDHKLAYQSDGALDNAARVIESQSYTAFGDHRTHDGEASRTSYIGRETDKETDLGFGACPEALRGSVRLYDPTYGRFLSVDPLWGKYLPYSAYQYCRNNPINLIDDSGLGDEPIRERPVATTREGQAAAMILAATPLSKKNKEITGPPDAYNCHSLAWSDGAGDPSDPANADYADVLPKWDNDPINNAESGWAQLSFNEPNQVGDRVIYFNEKKDKEGKGQGYVVPTHSAIVVGVDECGNANLVISKWGQGPGFLHHPRDVPDSYSEQESTAVTTDNDTYSTRVYYRKQDPK